MVLPSPPASSTVAPTADFTRIPCYKLSSVKFKVFSAKFFTGRCNRSGCCKKRYVGFVFSNNKFHSKWIPHVCARSSGEDGGSSGAGNPDFNSKIVNLTRRSANSIVIKRVSNELDGNNGDSRLRENLRFSSGGNFASFREDPIVDKLRTQLGVIHPLPSPPVNRNILGLFLFFFFVGVGFDKLWTRARRARSKRGALIRAQVPMNFSTFLEKDLQRKESVEWVNMVLGKLWKVYRGGLENWLVGLLQPVIDDLKKPDYVQRVEVKQFSLGDEPLSIRSVERRTSRRANDLQYQIGLRYTGGARMLLMLSLKFGIVSIALPVGVRDFDIDGELWVKLRLIPTEPWVGAVSWAFVALPKIKFELSPFRLFNLMAIPVLSMFLTKLLTEDLPRLFVRPKKIVLDFQKGKASGPMASDFKSGEMNKKNKDYSGELSVTLFDACNLPYMFYGKTDPYVILSLGNQTIRSKKNSRTTVIGSPGEPIWNQDFVMFVSNPRKQKLLVQVKDSLGFADVKIGAAEIDLGTLQDTVPIDTAATLKGGWGLLRKGNCGEVLLRLTYKAYVEDEEDDSTVKDSVDPDVSEDDLSEFDEAFPSFHQIQNDSLEGTVTNKESFMDDLAALIVSEEFQGIVASETGIPKASDDRTTSSTVSATARSRGRSAQSTSSKIDSTNGVSNGSVLVWLSIVTGIAVLIAINISGSSLFNP